VLTHWCASASPSARLMARPGILHMGHKSVQICKVSSVGCIRCHISATTKLVQARPTCNPLQHALTVTSYARRVSQAQGVQPHHAFCSQTLKGPIGAPSSSVSCSTRPWLFWMRERSAGRVGLWSDVRSTASHVLWLV